MHGGPTRPVLPEALGQGVCHCRTSCFADYLLCLFVCPYDPGHPTCRALPSHPFSPGNSPSSRYTGLKWLKRLGRQGWQSQTGARYMRKRSVDGVGERMQLCSITRLRAHGLRQTSIYQLPIWSRKHSLNHPSDIQS
jgi:hypothetical protein